MYINKAFSNILKAEQNKNNLQKTSNLRFATMSTLLLFLTLHHGHMLIQLSAGSVLKTLAL